MRPGLTDVAYCVDDNAEYRRMAEVSVHSLASVCSSPVRVSVFFPPWSPPSDAEVARFRRIAYASQAPRIVLCTFPSKYAHILRAVSDRGSMKLGPMTYARFLLPMAMEGSEQCLYVDCDTLFTKDPVPFLERFDHASASAAHTAGVRDLVSLIRPERFYESKWYVNCGVMLMDLSLWRKEDLSQRLMFDALTENRHFNDQDSLNANCFPVELPCELNFLGAWLNFGIPVSEYNSMYGRGFGSFEEAVSAAAVLHYTGRLKPLRWLSHGGPLPKGREFIFHPYAAEIGRYSELIGENRSNDDNDGSKEHAQGAARDGGRASGGEAAPGSPQVSGQLRVG